MTKADAKEVMEACRLVFAGKKQPSAGGAGGGGGGVVKRKATAAGNSRALPGSRDAAFMAALNAARRRPDTSN
jgi:hypothetical protein